MRKIELNREEQAQAIDLTPMLDVVFILLIFFIVTAAFIKTPGIDVNRTKTVTAEASKPGILVAISQNDEIWIDKNPVKDNQVKLQLLRLYTENPKGGLVIQVDEKASVKKIAHVADVAKEIGINKIAVSTLND